MPDEIPHEWPPKISTIVIPVPLSDSALTITIKRNGSSLVQELPLSKPVQSDPIPKSKKGKGVSKSDSLTNGVDCSDDEENPVEDESADSDESREEGDSDEKDFEAQLQMAVEQSMIEISNILEQSFEEERMRDSEQN
eukprot:TRINITY_DN12698_c0_g1_i2.p1 TRINITY_DN12698_c0_g1~~TRINITY_DN12698_c0_g1_i2.p1  ORF type:complete len:138 (+),score=51.26 TRINITY_DN12698_c0_g1_i2:81-494(+)